MSETECPKGRKAYIIYEKEIKDLIDEDSKIIREGDSKAIFYRPIEDPEGIDQTQLHALEVKGGELYIESSGGAGHKFVVALANFYLANGGPNYFSMTVEGTVRDEIKRFEIVIRDVKPGTKSQGEIIQDLKKEIAGLRSQGVPDRLEELWQFCLNNGVDVRDDLVGFRGDGGFLALKMLKKIVELLKQGESGAEKIETQIPSQRVPDDVLGGLEEKVRAAEQITADSQHNYPRNQKESNEYWYDSGRIGALREIREIIVELRKREVGS